MHTAALSYAPGFRAKGPCLLKLSPIPPRHKKRVTVFLEVMEGEVEAVAAWGLW